MTDTLGYYQILEIPPTADYEMIKNAYRQKAKIWHPDSNQSAEAVKVFQKLTEAHDVLSNQTLRQRYDILSLCCLANNFPRLDKLELISDGFEDVNLRAFNQKVIRADLFHYNQQNTMQAITQDRALQLCFHNSLINWCCGWWHPKAFGLNLHNIIHNFIFPVDNNQSCRLLLINMLVHADAKRFDKAAACGLAACDFLPVAAQKIVRDFVAGFGVALKRSKAWNIAYLRLVQLIAPLVGIGILFLLILVFYEFRGQDSSTINYYQNVDLGHGNKTIDDVVVGKVISIPVDKSDVSKLYHLNRDVAVMYGPSEQFDVLLNAPRGTTVRLTGITPDNIWGRIMIDNGEMGFVPLQVLTKGIGNEIPFGSSIIK